ncbi:MAG TPA: hypothetical protein PKH25_10745, partial [Syntrophales bacterium]|nr:hypothetical protein [Syntrophales bacterium]
AFHIIGIPGDFFIPVCRSKSRRGHVMESEAKSVPWRGRGWRLKRWKLGSYEVKKIGKANRQHRFRAYPNFATSRIRR